jgi:hypothetical protein
MSRARSPVPGNSDLPAALPSSSSMIRPALLRLYVTAVAVLVVSACGGGGGAIPAFTLFTGIAIADLNGDTKPDLVTSNSFIAGSPPHPGQVTVSLQQAATPGAFAAGVDYPVGADPFFTTTGDLNSDGRIDLLATNSGDDSLSLLEQSPVAAGVFLPETRLAIAAQPEGSVVADINGDGLVDIVTTGWYLALLFNTRANPGDFIDGGTINTGTYLPSVSAGDIDGDGRIDLAATDPVSGSVLVFLQDAAPVAPGSFSGMNAYPAGNQPIDVEIADLDGDGKPDLAVASLGTPADPDTAGVAVLLQEHDPALQGLFRTAVGYQTGARSQDVAVGDLNNDGVPDLAVANAGHLDDSGSISLLFQGGVPGTFRAAQNLPGVSQPLALAIGDLNGDQLQDVAVADGGAIVLFQDSQVPGTFLPAVHIDR